MQYKNLCIDQFMKGLRKRNAGEFEFHQAVQEVAEDIIPFVNKNREFLELGLLERLTEPDRIIIFRVCWEDDAGNIRINRGFRVQFNNSIGPYKGGLRFHPSVNLSILKFLGFEQVFKNSLTSLPLGAGKGGANFNPRGKSDREVMRFCQSFMTELQRHIGPNIDVPAGDIGVGAREISYMFGQYKRLHNEFNGALTGKSLEFGGSLMRKEATGYGAAYFMEDMLKQRNDSIDGKRCVISGSGNVAQYCAEKVLELGGKVIAMSDSKGMLYIKDGLDEERLQHIIKLKTELRKPLETFCEKYGGEFYADKKPWGIECDIAFPCATQNELDLDDANLLVKNGCIAIAEGANMPTSIEGIRAFQEAKILYAPGKAANAGGVAVSGLEMSQNSMRMSWSREKLDQHLRDIMGSIHAQCLTHGKENGYVDYVKGANVAGFVKVAKAMLAYGVV